MPEVVHVLLVDDQESFRSAARAVLDRLDDFDLVGEAVDGFEAVRLAAHFLPELVIMDINMPDMDGMEATRRIVNAAPDVTVVLCSTYESVDLPTKVMSCGARAYFNKEELTAKLVRRLWDENHAVPS